MQVYPVNLELHLPPDQIVEFFLFQWHTPVPITGGGFQKINSPVLEQKRDSLQQFAEWLKGYDAERLPKRPVFVMLPELSVPLSQVPILEAMAAAMSRPTVVIAGLEHLQPQEYARLHARMSDMPFACPEVTAPWVNAAIVIARDEQGQFTKCVQTKLHRSAPEEPQLHAGDDLLLFLSPDQSNGHRLNFCVQICSDFTDAAFVNDLRVAAEGLLAGHPLDVLCLLQHNKDQEAEQFLQAYQAYFTPPSGMAETRGGCIVVVNNANPEIGTTAKFGGSRFIFDREIAMVKFLSAPPPTYWVQDDHRHRITSAVVREYGPGVYRFEYKPKYLVSGNPGTGQILPFVNPPMFCPIDAVLSLPSGDRGFFPVYPETFWWRCKTRSSDCAIHQRVASGWLGQPPPARPPPEMCDHCWEDYSIAGKSWRDYMANHPEQPRNILRRYFEHQKELPGFPEKTVEPNEWVPEVAAAARELVMTHALLADAAAGAGLAPLAIAFDEISHASLGTKSRVLYLWCQKELPDEWVIAQCRADNRLMIASIATPLLLVPIACIRYLTDKTARRRALDGESGSITSGTDVPFDKPHLAPIGGVARVKSTMAVVTSCMLLQQVHHAGDAADMHARLGRLLQEELS